MHEDDGNGSGNDAGKEAAWNMIEDTSAKREFLILAASVAGLGILIAVAFSSSDPLLILRTTLSLAWLFLLPGYFLTLRWREHLNLAERIAIGVALQAAVLSMLSYVLGIAGWHVATHGYVLPAVSIIVGLALEYLGNRARLRQHHAHHPHHEPPHADGKEKEGEG